MQDRKYYLERYKAKEGPTRITTYHKHIALRVPQKLYEAKTHLSLSLKFQMNQVSISSLHSPIGQCFEESEGSAPPPVPNIK